MLRFSIYNQFYNFSLMQFMRQLQLSIFERMGVLHRGCMQSQLAFVFFQILKLFFRDAFIITVFAFPLPAINKSINNFFQLMKSLNFLVSLTMALGMAGLIGLIAYPPKKLQERFKNLLQVVVPWVDNCALLIIAINLHLLRLNVSENLWLVAFNVLAVVSASALTVFYSLFNFSKEPRSSNLLKRREAQMVTFCDLATLFLCYYLAAACFPGRLSNELSLIFSLIQFCLSVAKIKQRVFMQFYLGDFSQSISSLFYFVELNLSLLAFSIYLLRLDLLMQNLFFILILMTSLEFSALNAYISRRNGNMYLSSASDLKNEEQAVIYLQRLCQLITKVEKEEEDIILTSLKKKHSINCKVIQCYCQEEQTLGDFIRDYVRCELQAITELFHTSLSVLISILYFKMVIFNYYPQILGKLTYYSSHFTMSLTQRYYRHSLTQYVREFIKKRNYEIDALDSQHMFKLEQIRGEIEGIIRGEIEVRSKLWKYLSRGLCRVGQLEENCNQSLGQISRIMSIFSENMIKFKKSKEFNLLLLFYFVKVGFLNNGKQIKENLKELYFGYKEEELYSIKEFKKFIYHKRSCVIETLIDTKTMGIITAASRNVEEMFGVPQNKVVGNSINNLMPQFMGEQHESIMAEWTRSGTWRTVGKLKEIYCIHKEQFCFSALLYLKIYIKDSNMHFITNIFKLNQSDFIVLNPSLKIEGMGKKSLKLLGESAKRVSLDLLVEHANGLLKQDVFPQGKLYRKTFLSLKNHEAEVDTYLQSLNMKFDEAERKEISRQFHQQLSSICQQKILIQFSVKRYRMAKVNFLVIDLRQSKRIDPQLHPTSTLLDRPIHQQNSRELEFDAQSDESSYEREENDQLLMDHNASSSMASLVEKENYVIAKTIQKFTAIIQKPEKIKDNRLSNFNILLVVILMLLSIINFVSFYCYRQMLLQIQGIFFADGAQSDVMQTTQIGYSYIYQLKSMLLSNSSSTEFDSMLTSARLVNTYVYSLSQANFASLITNVTQLSKDRFYAYLQQPATWTLNKKPGKVITHQFIENMYYLSMRVINQLQALKRANSTKINSTFFEELFSNFPQMQHLNEFYLVYYQKTSDTQHDMLNYFTVCSMSVYFVLSLVLSLALNHYFKFRFDQLIRSFSFFSHISNQYLQKMKDYYSMLLSNVVEREKLKQIDLHEQALFEIDTYQLFQRSDVTKGSLSTKIKFINYENYYKWIFIFLLFSLLNAINYLATDQVRTFFPQSQLVITQFNELMRSENRLLQAYFNLRAAYSLNPTGYINQSLYNNMIGYLNRTDTKFNSIAEKVTTVYAKYDPTFETTFINVLVTSVCKLSSASDLTPFQNTKCVKELKLNILDGGILIAMNFFQRNVRTALQDLRSFYIDGTRPPPKSDYFRGLNFVQLDKMLIYMFKMYQLTQAVAFASYIKTIDVITYGYLKLTIAITAFFIVVMLVWLKSITTQKKNLSYLYGHLLLIPFMILKSNSRIASTLKDSIEYSEI